MEYKARILVVDDNPATLYSTSRILRAASFEVLEGSNGTQALELANSATPDIVLLDVNLPDIHGFEVCRRLRDNPATSRLPVVHVSATFVGEINKAEGLDAGGDGYLTHPVEPPVLIATVNAFLRARRAEEEMRLNETKFRAVFNNAPSGIVLLDNSLRYVEVNPAMCAILRRNAEDIVGRSLRDFQAAESLKSLDEIEQSLSQEGSYRGVLPLVASDGNVVQLEWYIASHTFPGLRLAIVTDVTERLHFENQRNQLLASERIARTEAERANRLKDEFLGTLSHELRSPLSSILLWTQMLQKHTGDSEQFTRGLASIERSARMQTQLISDLLDVSRIISGKFRLEVNPFDLGMTIRSALEGLVPAVEAKGIDLQTHFDATLGMIAGDSERVQQVVWNLLSNAIKFTPKGGRIDIRAERSDSEVTFSVADTGPGIAPELMPYIFDRFRQGDVSTNRTHGGLGLGLAIVKHVVELHGGTVAANSRGVGKGATFVATLPIIGAPHISSKALPQENLLSGLKGVKILVVDDDFDVCTAISRVLGDAGATVRGATGVDDALEELNRLKPQVLVSDLSMPERDGYDLIREVRARGVSEQELPAIALTALARPEDRQRALLAGYQIHLPKPVDLVELASVISALLGRIDQPKSHE